MLEAQLATLESESVCLSLSDECIWFWWSLSLSDDVTEGSPEAFRPTVLYRSDESLRVESEFRVVDRFLNSAVFLTTTRCVLLLAD